VPSEESAPGKQEQRFAAYLESLARAAHHADRSEPLKAYCRGLLLPLERKSVEPMAARLAPHNVRQTHQSLHHLVASSPWDDGAVLAAVRRHALTAMTAKTPVAAWIVDDTGFPKKGKHSAGVARQYCGQLGKQENCQVAVSLSVATAEASLPVAWRLYLPESWAGDSERRRQAGVPDEVRFQTKQKIALGQIREALSTGIAAGVVLADAAYGNDSGFREELEDLGLQYAVGVQGSTTVWRPGEGPLPAEPYKGTGRPPKLLRRGAARQPLTLKQLAAELPREAFRNVSWRAGTKQRLRSRFAALRVRPAHRDYERDEPHPEQWLLIEWPPNEAEPAHYWLANLPAATKRKDLVAVTKQRWIIERDYQELKQELGLGHYEGRGWRGFHHHATLCIAAYGFLVADRARFSPSARVGTLRLPLPEPPAGQRPRGAPHPSRAA
jgi:SRSO17 transposase